MTIDLHPLDRIEMDECNAGSVCKKEIYLFTKPMWINRDLFKDNESAIVEHISKKTGDITGMNVFQKTKKSQVSYGEPIHVSFDIYPISDSCYQAMI